MSSFYLLYYCARVLCSIQSIKFVYKLTRLQHAAQKKRHKTDKNWVRNISSRPLDENETQLLSYGLKHSVTPKHIPTDDIVSSVESAWPVRGSYQNRLRTTSGAE